MSPCCYTGCKDQGKHRVKDGRTWPADADGTSEQKEDSEILQETGGEYKAGKKWVVWYSSY